MYVALYNIILYTSSTIQYLLTGLVLNIQRNCTLHFYKVYSVRRAVRNVKVYIMVRMYSIAEIIYIYIYITLLFTKSYIMYTHNVNFYFNDTSILMYTIQYRNSFF